ncbi:DUF4365 domain-containing protein [Methanomassiliicoccales archaeon LGM-RCC1]|nr:DUF4365 domain-containing protein [Methanomassiliicoccales archaeon LGM-RCC1]
MSEAKRAYCGSYDREFEPNDKKYNLIKEEISYSFLKSIASYIGADFSKTGRMIDDDGIDVSLRLPQGRLGPTKNPKPGIDVQMKCTSSPKYDKDEQFLNFDLSTDVFNLMKNTSAVNPTIFMILILPKKISEWVGVDYDKLMIKNHALWYNPADCDKVPEDNQQTVRLKIPVKNIVNPDSLQMMIRKAANEELISNMGS